MADAKVAALQACKAEVMDLCAAHHCNPILVRLAWHDAGTFNKDSAEPWPRCGGANGSIRFEPEINHGANAGLVNALQLLQPIKDKHPEVGWADLIQLASAAAIEQAGGPVIDMKYGRKDATTPQCCVDEGALPAGNAPFPDADTPQAHLRNVFYRMGFGDEGIVALSGAHTLGRAQKDRSGEGAECTKFTAEGVCPRGAGAPGCGKPGGSAWTPNWLKFDNSYFQTVPDEGCDPELLKLATDRCLFVDEGFLPFAQKYKASQEAFFEDYKKAHKMLSELGAVWEPEGGITI
ncbi:APX [Ectocarpus sp. CCAP 1310/34]|nr:APX [Ectocarpus sp. CCAP 1310/34]